MATRRHTAQLLDRSGTKPRSRRDRALALHRQKPGNLRRGLAGLRGGRSVEVLRIQNAARNSTEWFENVARYVNLRRRSLPIRC